MIKEKKIMKLKKQSLIMLMLIMALLIVGCSQGTEPTSTETNTAEGNTPAESIELTIEELGEYNGKDGQPAYVAVDGIIYDVTNSAAWKNGEHNGFEAGKDLTVEIKENSPHGIDKLDNVEEIGTIVK